VHLLVEPRDWERPESEDRRALVRDRAPGLSGRTIVKGLRAHDVLGDESFVLLSLAYFTISVSFSLVLDSELWLVEHMTGRGALVGVTAACFGLAGVRRRCGAAGSPTAKTTAGLSCTRMRLRCCHRSRYLAHSSVASSIP
jgi:hypothetical protein